MRRSANSGCGSRAAGLHYGFRQHSGVGGPMARRIAEVVAMLLVAAWLGVAVALANTITTTTPVQNEEAAPGATNIAVTWDGTMDAATLTQSTFRVQGDQ